MKNLPEGTWVRWNGSGDVRFPRYYTGQILKVNEHSYDVLDTEWFATSEVTKTRVVEVYAPGL